VLRKDFETRSSIEIDTGHRDNLARARRSRNFRDCRPLAAYLCPRWIEGIRIIRQSWFWNRYRETELPWIRLAGLLLPSPHRRLPGRRETRKCEHKGGKQNR
jgi:hypothetical protein